MKQILLLLVTCLIVFVACSNVEQDHSAYTTSDVVTEIERLNTRISAVEKTSTDIMVGVSNFICHARDQIWNDRKNIDHLFLNNGIDTSQYFIYPSNELLMNGNDYEELCGPIH